MAISTSIVIDGPAPAEPPFTLLAAADATPLADDHWRAGVAVIPPPGGPTRGWRTCINTQAKTAARVATTGNVANTATGAPNVVDGVTLVNGDRVLVKSQTAPETNGIYTVTTVGTGANGVWARATDMDTWGEVVDATVAVTAGTLNAGKTYVTNAIAGGTLGTTAINWQPYTSTGAQPDKVLDALLAATEHKPFGIYQGITCTTRSYTSDQLRDVLVQAFNAYAHTPVEDQFWNGTLEATTPNLADAGATSLGTAASVVEAFGRMEDQAAKLGAGSMIHCRPRIATLAASKNLLRVDNRRLRTVAGGTIVVPGAGYTGGTPEGLTAVGATTEYAILTGPVRVLRGPTISFPDADNPAAGNAFGTNDSLAVVEQEFITLFDPAKRYAALIDRAL